MEHSSNDAALAARVHPLITLFMISGDAAKLAEVTDEALLGVFAKFGLRVGWKKKIYQLECLKVGRADMKEFGRALRRDVARAFEWDGKALGKGFLALLSGHAAWAEQYTVNVRSYFLHVIVQNWSEKYRELFHEELCGYALAASEGLIRRTMAMLVKSTPNPHADVI